MVMVKPWLSRWSSLVYGKLHHEPFDPCAQEWDFPSSGPLSGANGALPWILFSRDLERFRREFPEWQVELVQPMMPLCYLIAGGISLRALMPGWSYALWRAVERMIEPWIDHLAMFARSC